MVPAGQLVSQEYMEGYSYHTFEFLSCGIHRMN